MKKYLLLIIFLMFTQKLFSQISSASVNIDSVSNHLITANIVTQPNWGKFWLTTSPFYGKKIIVPKWKHSY